MQTKFTLAAAFALASCVLAQEDGRPRIYYPRQVNRIFDNNSSDTELPPTGPPSGRKGLDSILDRLLGDEREDDNDDRDRDHGRDRDRTRQDDRFTPNTNTQDNGIIIAPTGLVFPDVAESTAPPTPLEQPIVESTVDKSASPNPGLVNIIVGPTGGSNAGVTHTVVTAPVQPPQVPPTEAPVPIQSAEPPAPSPEESANSSSEGGLVDVILDPLTSTDATDATPTTAPAVEAPVASSAPSGSTEEAPSNVASSEVSTSTSPGLLDPILDPVTSILATAPTANGTDITPSATTTGGGLISEILPTVLPTPTESPAGTTSPSPSATDLISVSVGVPISDILSTPGSVSITPTDSPTVPSTDLPVTNVTSSVIPTTPGTPLPTVIATTPGSSPASSSSAAPSTVIIPVPTTTLTSSTNKAIVTSIVPTATLSDGENWLPTTIVADVTSFTFMRPTDTVAATTSQAMPTNIPDFILPVDAGAQQPQPAGSVVINIGFLYPLNYNHVSKNTVAAAQIFKYLPEALANAGGFDVSKVQMSMLVPLDTRSKWGYVTTIAKLYYPDTMLDSLQMNLWAPNSGIYNHPDPLVRDLTAVINPKIDIFGGGAQDAVNMPAPGKGGNDDAFSAGGSGNKANSRQVATTAGIAIGALGVAGLYGAAMFILARRYKRKKQLHRRSSSISSASDMQYAGPGSPAMMGGSLLPPDASNFDNARHSGGTSSRTANISAPVAGQNSLGWN